MQKLLVLILLSLLIQPEPYIIFDASQQTEANWRIVNDGVMGGISDSQMNTIDNYAQFSGNVSLENNGGFAMTQLNCNVSEVEKYSKIQLILQGDGKSYQFRIKNYLSTYYSYVHSFKTSGEKETIVLELKDFYPSFRGRRLRQPSFNHNSIEQIAILIGNKKQEDFNLRLYSAKLIK